jgi:hypothetical protein
LEKVKLLQPLVAGRAKFSESFSFCELPKSSKSVFLRSPWKQGEAVRPAAGEMAEWSNALVLKTSVPQGTGGSNPSFSATIEKPFVKTKGFLFSGICFCLNAIQQLKYQKTKSSAFVQEFFNCC